MAVCILKQLLNLPRQLLIHSPSVIVFTHPETAVVPCGCLYPQTAAELTQAVAHSFPFSYSVYSPLDSCSPLWLSVHHSTPCRCRPVWSRRAERSSPETARRPRPSTSRSGRPATKILNVVFYISNCFTHRVDRLLGFSPVVPVGTPPPLPHSQASVSLPFSSGGGGGRSLAGDGLGGPNSDEGTDTVVLKVYMYSTLWVHSIFTPQVIDHCRTYTIFHNCRLL